jgi:segregation and condensation protein A
MHKVSLDVFEGPLDLLLFLIKKEEIDIYDIPILRITEQYMEYLEIMKLFNIDIAGEYIVMAATLMQIKSRCLLPQQATEQTVEQQDPRDELILRLIEYKKFKEAASTFEDIYKNRLNIFKRQDTTFQIEFEKKDKTLETSLFDLISAFSRVLKKIPQGTFSEIIKDEFTVEQKIEQLRHKIATDAQIILNVLIASATSKAEIVALFLALLELVRLKEIHVFQNTTFGEICVRKR